MPTSSSSRYLKRLWHGYVEAIKGDYPHPDRLLCLIGIHKPGYMAHEGYNALGQSYEPNHISRWHMQFCDRCNKCLVNQRG